MSRRMKLVFTISILLNIVLMGVGAGFLYRMCQDIEIPGEVSPEARHFIARTYQEGRNQVKPLIDEVKARRAKVEDIIVAENFDREAYIAAVTDMLDTRDKITRKRAEIMGEALSELPSEDRKQFAKRILDGLEGKRMKRGGYHGRMRSEKDETQPPQSAP